MKPGEGLKSPGARRELRTQNGDPENPLFKGQVERVQSADKASGQEGGGKARIGGRSQGKCFRNRGLATLAARARETRTGTVH